MASPAQWCARDYTEILVSNVLRRNTNFGARPGTIDMLIDIIFNHRVFLSVIEVELVKADINREGV